MFFSITGNYFRIFSIQHIIPIFIVIFLSILIYYSRKKIKKIIYFIEFLIILLIFLLYILYYIWVNIHNIFHYKEDLPLELCNLMFLMIIPLFITKNKYIFEFSYFIGIGGSLYAIITPTLYYGFPHFIYFFFFISHILIIISPIIMIFVHDFKICFFSLIRSIIFFNIIGIIIFIIDIIIDANYMFLREKPQGITLFNIMGDWPVYLIISEILAIITSFVLYIPFFLYNKKLKVVSS